MNDKFDELAKQMAQSVTRRGALRRFGIGFGGIALATLGIANKAEATWVCDCNGPLLGCKSTNGGCYRHCLCVCSGGGGRPC